MSRTSAPHMDTAIGELELDGLDPDTAQPPKESRLRDVKAGLALYTNLRDADQTS